MSRRFGRNQRRRARATEKRLSERVAELELACRKANELADFHAWEHRTAAEKGVLEGIRTAALGKFQLVDMMRRLADSIVDGYPPHLRQFAEGLLRGVQSAKPRVDMRLGPDISADETHVVTSVEIPAIRFNYAAGLPRRAAG